MFSSQKFRLIKFELYSKCNKNRNEFVLNLIVVYLYLLYLTGVDSSWWGEEDNVEVEEGDGDEKL
jgi:hypothetical protein